MSGKLKSLAVAAALGVLTFLAVFFQWFSSLDLLLQDGIYQRPGTVDGNIKVVAIDEKTLEALGPFETWTREPYAQLIQTLNQGDNAPKVIALDVLLTGEKGEEDQLLVDACRNASNVVLASNLVFSTQLERDGSTAWANALHIDMVEKPFGELEDLVATGFANTVQDSRDNSVRYALLEREGYLSFAAAVVEKARGELSLEGLSVDANGGILIDYTGTPGAYETLSLIDVLEGNIPAQAFRDSIVLVGACAAGMGDSYPVPTGHGGQMYGVEIHANVVQGLLEGRCLTQASRLYNGLVCGVLAFLLTLLISRLRLWLGGVAAAAVIAGQVGVCFWLDGQGLVVNVIALPLAMVAVFVWGVAVKYAAEALQKRKIVRAFRKYVAPQVVEEISKNHDYQLKLGGEKRHIAVLFVDIRGFTPLSEALQPEQVVEILNEYLSLVTQAVFQNGGTLDKFIGDAAMAVFNAPFDSDDYVYKAVCAARDIAAGSERIGATFMERFGKKVSYGIGVNCGDAVVGNIGSQFRMDYTAIGDTVNTAARLEANAKAGQILISQFVCERLPNRIDVTEIGEIPLKGKSKGVMVYALDRVLAPGEEPAQKKEEPAQG